MSIRKYLTLNKNKGFTLVEVIISIGFLCIACGIIIQLFIASGEVRSRMALKEMASVKASNAIEACRISDSPADVGLNIFNKLYTDYEKTDSGYIIREYFNEEWMAPQEGKAPVFTVRIEISESQNIPDTKESFGDTVAKESVIVSGLYDIKVTAGYVDAGHEDGILAEFATARHYIFRENGE